MEINGKISSDLESLNTLSKTYSWIPNEDTIRPSPQILLKKQMIQQHVKEAWPSLQEYIKVTVFKQQTGWIFKECLFPYGTTGKHFVLWHTDFPFTHEFEDKEVNEVLKGFVKGDFAWYKNPKPTVLEFYHIQVFTSSSF